MTNAIFLHFEQLDHSLCVAMACYPPVDLYTIDSPELLLVGSTQRSDCLDKMGPRLFLMCHVGRESRFLA